MEDGRSRAWRLLQVVRYASDTQLEVVSPKTVEKAREHFGCDSMTGVRLEDQGEGAPAVALPTLPANDLPDLPDAHPGSSPAAGGCPTSSSHWDSRYLMGEVMTGQTSGEAAATRSIWSAITLGLAEDSGWYAAEMASG